MGCDASAALPPPLGKGGIAFLHPNISKSSPEGIPHLISYISYLISWFPAPSATGDREGRPYAECALFSIFKKG